MISRDGLTLEEYYTAKVCLTLPRFIVFINADVLLLKEIAEKAYFVFFGVTEEE